MSKWKRKTDREYHFWTPDEIRKIQWMAGYCTRKEVAQKLGLTVRQVIHKASCLHLRFNAGFTLCEVSESLGYNLRTVQRMLRIMGEEGNVRRISFNRYMIPIDVIERLELFARTCYRFNSSRTDKMKEAWDATKSNLPTDKMKEW